MLDVLHQTFVVPGGDSRFSRSRCPHLPTLRAYSRFPYFSWNVWHPGIPAPSFYAPEGSYDMGTVYGTPERPAPRRVGRASSWKKRARGGVRSLCRLLAVRTLVKNSPLSALDAYIEVNSLIGDVSTLQTRAGITVTKGEGG